MSSTLFHYRSTLCRTYNIQFLLREPESDWRLQKSVLTCYHYTISLYFLSFLSFFALAMAFANGSSKSGFIFKISSAVFALTLGTFSSHGNLCSNFLPFLRFGEMSTCTINRAVSQLVLNLASSFCLYPVRILSNSRGVRP